MHTSRGWWICGICLIGELTTKSFFLNSYAMILLEIIIDVSRRYREKGLRRVYMCLFGGGGQEGNRGNFIVIL